MYGFERSDRATNNNQICGRQDETSVACTRTGSLRFRMSLSAASLDVSASHPRSEQDIPVNEERLREIGLDTNDLFTHENPVTLSK
jgi:hypothetical protein